ncbi:MAG: PqqD family protein [Bacteroides sp.]|nr:PqqD family protein [Bacteroides sp.]MCM1413249.1 PqqD family protein [Bacteroides sp.]MCM1471441.1 PqqD family protein [Bacteroides sp.]
MKTRPDLTLRQLGSQFMIVVNSDQNSPIQVHSLNATAADIWQYAATLPDFTADDIARRLTEIYDVDFDTALKDSRQLLSDWLHCGLITE